MTLILAKGLRDEHRDNQSPHELVPVEDVFGSEG